MLIEKGVKAVLVLPTTETDMVRIISEIQNICSLQHKTHEDFGVALCGQGEYFAARSAFSSLLRLLKKDTPTTSSTIYYAPYDDITSERIAILISAKYEPLLDPMLPCRSSVVMRTYQYDRPYALLTLLSIIGNYAIHWNTILNNLVCIPSFRFYAVNTRLLLHRESKHTFSYCWHMRSALQFLVGIPRAKSEKVCLDSNAFCYPNTMIGELCRGSDASYSKGDPKVERADIWSCLKELEEMSVPVGLQSKDTDDHGLFWLDLVGDGEETPGSLIVSIAKLFPGLSMSQNMSTKRTALSLDAICSSEMYCPKKMADNITADSVNVVKQMDVVISNSGIGTQRIAEEDPTVLLALSAELTTWNHYKGVTEFRTWFTDILATYRSFGHRLVCYIDNAKNYATIILHRADFNTDDFHFESIGANYSEELILHYLSLPHNIEGWSGNDTQLLASIAQNCKSEQYEKKAEVPTS
jgi:hypothetical protein